MVSLLEQLRSAASPTASPTASDLIPGTIASWRSDGTTLAGHVPFREMLRTPKDYERRALTAALWDRYSRHLAVDLDIAAEIERIHAGAPVLRIAHQPTLFTALNVVGQATLLHRLASSARIGGAVVVFMLVDYDDCQNRNLWRARLPDLSSLQTKWTAPSVPKSARSRILRAVPLDTGRAKVCAQQLSEAWQAMVERFEASRRGSFLDMDTLVQEAFVPHRSYARFNERLLELALAAMSRDRVLLVRSSELLSYSSRELLALLRLHSEIAAAFSEVQMKAHDYGVKLPQMISADVPPIWRVCPSCCRRLAVSWVEATDAVIEWECENCDHRRAEILGEAIETEQCCGGPAVVPKVILDHMLDWSAYGFAGGSSYVGGLEHTVAAHLVMRIVGLTPGPELIFDPLDGSRAAAPDLLRRNPCLSVLMKPGNADSQLATDLMGCRYPALLYLARNSNGQTLGEQLVVDLVRARSNE